MKKILSVLMAVVMLFTMFTIASTAATAPKLTVAANKDTAKVGDTITVTVSTSKNSKMCSATLSLIYNESYFEVTNKSVSGAFDFADIGVKDGEVTFAGIANTKVADSATTIFTVSFKVLKTGGKIRLNVEEVYVVDGGNDVDVTNKILGKTLTINCSHVNKQDTITKQPTCTDAGTKTSKCKDCGASLGTSSIPAKGHQYGTATVTKQPTCTEKGVKESKCKNCDAVKKQDIAAKGHSAGTSTVTKQPTCTEAGVKTTKCKNCSAVVKTEQVEKLGHAFGDKVVSQEATCTEKGVKESKCSRCNATVKEEIPMVDHKYGEKIIVTEPTATKDGKFKRVCSVCGNEKFGVIEKIGAELQMGDLDGDGEVSAFDARKILQYSTLAITLTPEQLKRADMNGDGKVTAFDARKVLQIAAAE